jgi:hypothetical protein
MGVALSLMALTALALAAGAIVLWRRGVRKQAALMLLLAAILAGNVAIWTWPDASGQAPVSSLPG